MEIGFWIDALLRKVRGVLVLKLEMSECMGFIVQQMSISRQQL